MKRWTWTALAALVVATAIPAGASTFLAMGMDELVAQSDAVVTGEVLKVESFRDSTGRVIVSEAMVQVDETVLGEAPTVVIIRTLGGTVDGYTVVAHGFPRFETGDRVLVFLSSQADGSSEVVGYRLGQYKVLRNRQGEDIAVPTLEPGVRLLTAAGGAAVRPRAMPLETIKAQIRAQARTLSRDVSF